MITALGNTREKTMEGLRKNRVCLRPLNLFFHPDPPLVGQTDFKACGSGIPETHGFAAGAAAEAMAENGKKIPDAVVMGITTGGMQETELHLKNNVTDPNAFVLHGLDTVTRHVAKTCGCKGPVFTVSTACSSGAAAIALAAKLIKRGLAKRVLAGGADALCRLTCHGFAALQLIDTNGARPFDAERRGMHLSEGAAVLLLEGGKTPPPGAMAQILGAGLSCDAYHATSPDPAGAGAAMAIRSALADARLYPGDIDYINLHGTGTIANDAAEAMAVNQVFGPVPPLMSSVKGATGHSLAAAGAIEAVICAMAVAEGFVPGTYGMNNPDPKLGIKPEKKPMERPLRTVLSNSFGFGGNNAAILIGDIESKAGQSQSDHKPSPMGVLAGVCLTGAGHTEASLEAFFKNQSCAGLLPADILSENLCAKSVRRLKRLSRMVAALSREAVLSAGITDSVSDIFFGTGWGSLTETNDFLTRLYANQEKLSSPMDFAGSVHNAPAGQAALMLGAKGANMTLTGENDSFEQALAAAWLMGPENQDPFLVLGADEGHSRLSVLFDPSAAMSGSLADGGGGFLLTRASTEILVQPAFAPQTNDLKTGAESLVETLGGPEAISQHFGVIFAGIPAAHADSGLQLIEQFLAIIGTKLPVVYYRKYTGQFASASAAAAGLGFGCMQKGFIPAGTAGTGQVDLGRKGILILNSGKPLTAVEMFRR